MSHAHDRCMKANLVFSNTGGWLKPGSVIRGKCEGDFLNDASSTPAQFICALRRHLDTIAEFLVAMDRAV